MKRLRQLIVNGNTRLSQGLIFPDELRVLDWFNCPLESLLSNFHEENLVILRIPHSQFKELEGD
jgi:hypothetical protein